MNAKILIADDEVKMVHLIRDFLENERFEVVCAYNGLQAYDLFLHDSEIDLFILDIMMPNMDGLEVCQKIRETSNKPIIMLTAKTREVDELFGFHSGADEYVKKPFSPTVLMARVKALLKRTVKKIHHFQHHDLIIDFDKAKTFIANKEIHVSKMEYALLQYFIENQSIVFSRRQLLDHVWGYLYEGTDRTVDTTINRLRKKLLQYSGMIQTVHGLGYRFEVTS